MSTPCPKRVCISVGSACGYRCIFCDNTHTAPTLQSLKNITKIFENFKNAEIIDISGFGDLLIHPEFENIVKFMTANKVSFSFITTAENLTPDKQELLRNSTLHHLNISLNSLNPETKKMLSGGKGDFDKVMTHFKEFVKKPRNYAVSISMVVSQYTFRETPDFVRFAVEHGVDLIHLHQPIVGIKYPEGFDLTYSEEEWSYFDEAHRIADEHKIPMGGFVKKGVEGKVEKLPINQCKAPWTEIVITPDGNIIPCTCGLGSYIIGNINTQSFAEIWDGEKVNILRNAILAGDNQFCKRCGRYE